MKRGRTFWAVGSSVFALGSVLLCTGCGAIFGGSRQTVQVDSSPQATVTPSPGGMTQTTPSTLSLLRKENYVLTFEKEGYEPKKFELQRKMRGGILALDLLLTGGFGIVVDFVTGSWFKIVPGKLNVVLTKKAGASSQLPDVINVRLSLENDKGPVQGLQVTSDVPGVSVKVEETNK